MKATKPKRDGNNNGNTKPVLIELYPEDLDCIETIKQAHGLLRVSDCIRFALRVAVRQAENSQSTT